MAGERLKIKMRLNAMTEIEATFEEADLQDAIRKAGALLDFDGKCGMCDGKEGAHDITLQSRITKDKGYKYTEFVCRNCGARRPFGAYRDGGGFFLKDWEEAYKKEQ